MKTSMWLLPRVRVETRSQAAFSSVEALIALCIGAFAVAAGMTVNSHELKLVKSTREASAASGVLEERVEQLRTANWRQMTDASYLASSYFGALPKSAAALRDYVEKIKVTAWPDESAATPILIEKTVKSDAVMLLSGTGLAAQRLAKIDVQITWTGKNFRSRTRELTTMISNGGVSRMNLPAMGTAGDSAPTPTPAPTSTPAPSATPAPTPTPTPTNNGNGNGRGNVAGKSGKA